MELEKIKELVSLMQTNDLSELEIVDGDNRIVLKRSWSQTGPGPVMVQAGPQPMAMGPATPPTEQEAAASTNPDENLVEVVAPMVGTFYAAPSPNADPFVELGRAVDEESVVCIIEAMKVMNEIKCTAKGTIRKVLVSNGSAVEFGQPLFLVEPD